MADLDLLTLRCPSCGALSGTADRQAAYGAEYRCVHCGVTAVLAVNRQLVAAEALVRAGERICGVCGEVVRASARFCQQGHALDRTCLACGEVFPAQHPRCDQCGRLQAEVQVAQAEARIQALALEKVPEGRIPVPGLGADALDRRIRTLGAQAAQVVPLRRLAKVLLALATASLLANQAWQPLLLVPVAWHLANRIARWRLRTLEEALSQHRQALAVVGRNARLDQEIGAVRAELLKLREAAPA